jgi:hypothetical protein
MKEQLMRDRQRAVVLGCACAHELPAAVAPDRRPVGLVFCRRCRHYAYWVTGEVIYCVSEPRLGMRGFQPDMTISTEPDPS